MQNAAPALPSPLSGPAGMKDVSLFGRFMTPDHVEYPCQVVAMSPTMMDVICAHTGEMGMSVICYVNHVGRVEGTIVRQNVGGFEVEIVSSERKREKIASKLEWVISHEQGGTVDDRIHERLTPRSTLSQISTMDGRAYPCRIIDISLSGAAIEIDVRPALGTRMVLGGPRRHRRAPVRRGYRARVPQGPAGRATRTARGLSLPTFAIVPRGAAWAAPLFRG